MKQQKVKLIKQSHLGAPGWLSWLSIPLLIFVSGHDLTVMRLSPKWGSALSMEPTSNSLIPSLSAPPSPCLSLFLSLTLSLSQNK